MRKLYFEQQRSERFGKEHEANNCASLKYQKPNQIEVSVHYCVDLEANNWRSKKYHWKYELVIQKSLCENQVSSKFLLHGSSNLRSNCFWNTVLDFSLRKAIFKSLFYFINLLFTLRLSMIKIKICKAECIQICIGIFSKLVYGMR